MMFDSIASIQKGLEQKRFSALELCDATIERIGRVDSSINAFSDLLFETARQEASASDHRRRMSAGLGMLDGIPIAVKNLIDAAPSSSDGGLGAAMRRASVEDAQVVTQLRAAGAVIIGTTHTDAGGFGTTTPQTVNPIAPHLIVGGSSGGSAAAVASGQAFGALGTDTGGSVRIPSACCGIAGFKPSWGRVPVEGVWPLATSFDHVGVLARSVADLIHLQQAIDNTPKPHIPIIALRPLGVGLVSNWASVPSSPGTAAMRRAADKILADGVPCMPILLPDHDSFLDTHVQNALREAYDYYEALGLDWSSFPETARDSLALGATVSDQQRDQNSKRRENIVSKVERLFEGVDVLLLPVLPMDVPTLGATRISLPSGDASMLEATIRFTALFNFTGHPVISMPAHSLSDGRAANIQIVGRRDSDTDLLAVALWLEDLLGVHIDYASLAGNIQKAEHQECVK